MILSVWRDFKICQKKHKKNVHNMIVLQRYIFWKRIIFPIPIFWRHFPLPIFNFAKYFGACKACKIFWDPKWKMPFWSKMKGEKIKTMVTCWVILRLKGKSGEKKEKTINALQKLWYLKRGIYLHFPPWGVEIFQCEIWGKFKIFW